MSFWEWFADKALATLLPLFPKDAHYYFCKPDIPRGLSEEELAKKAGEFQLTGKKICVCRKKPMQVP